MPLGKEGPSRGALDELLTLAGNVVDAPIFIEQCQSLLDSEWDSVVRASENDALVDHLSDAALIDAIRRSVNSRTKTYRYVLPTQLLAKAVDAALDCTCLQASRGGPGAFDARTVAHKVIVPFDQANERVLGGSAEPYVSNPLRVAEISAAHRSAQKNQSGWDDLCLVLDEVQNRSDAAFTLSGLRQVLTEIVKRLETVRVTFPVPGRISHSDCLQLIEAFLAQKSGGERFEAVTAALFDAIGRHFAAYAEVRRAKVTAADAASGMSGDIECLDAQGEIVLVIEPKDRQLTITQLKDKVPGLRENKISEAFFVAGKGIRRENGEAIRELIDREFASGQNIYVTELVPLCTTLLALLGEKGRRTFLESIGRQLHEHSDVHHRRAWAQALAGV